MLFFFLLCCDVYELDSVTEFFDYLCSMDRRNKRSRVRKEDDEGDITYINAKNKHFNKKVHSYLLTYLSHPLINRLLVSNFQLERYYDAHTKEIRDNFERGTFFFLSLSQFLEVLSCRHYTDPRS